MSTIELPRLAEGTELIGEYEGSGLKTPYYLARRADGNIVQLSRLLHLVAVQVDGRRSVEEIADTVSKEFGRPLTPDNVSYLLETKLQPMGLVAGDHEVVAAPPLLLGLRARLTILPERATGLVAAVFRPLFLPLVWLPVLVALVALDVWLFGHGLGPAVREALLHPVYLLALFGVVVASGLFHEIGHAAACRYGGARPGAVGVGIYLVWPAFFTNVTDSYRLNRRGRLRVDLGGVYFNLIFALVAAGAYFVTGFEPLLLVVAIQHLEIIEQFMPFVRLDGYYVISDLTGIPDLFSRVRPVLHSLVPWRRAHPQVAELKRFARVVLTGWVLLTVPFLLFNLGLLAWQGPQIARLTVDSLQLQLETLTSTSSVVSRVLAGIQMIVVPIPLVGIALLFWRLGRSGVALGWRRARRSPALSAAVASLVVMAASLVILGVVRPG